MSEQPSEVTPSGHPSDPVPSGNTPICQRHYRNPAPDPDVPRWARDPGAAMLTCAMPVGHEGEHGQVEINPLARGVDPEEPSEPIRWDRPVTQRKPARARR